MLFLKQIEKVYVFSFGIYFGYLVLKWLVTISNKKENNRELKIEQEKKWINIGD